MWCLHCAYHSNAALAQRVRLLKLLALVEHPDTLPAENAGKRP